jgi:hypothetical protein
LVSDRPMSCLGSAHEPLEAHEMVEEVEDEVCEMVVDEADRTLKVEEDEVCEMVVDEADKSLKVEADEADRTLKVVGVVYVTWMVEVDAPSLADVVALIWTDEEACMTWMAEADALS